MVVVAQSLQVVKVLVQNRENKHKGLDFYCLLCATILAQDLDSLQHYSFIIISLAGRKAELLAGLLKI